jgi:hypothetical protein
MSCKDCEFFKTDGCHRYPCVEPNKTVDDFCGEYVTSIKSQLEKIKLEKERQAIK